MAHLTATHDPGVVHVTGQGFVRPDDSSDHHRTMPLSLRVYGNTSIDPNGNRVYQRQFGEAVEVQPDGQFTRDVAVNDSDLVNPCAVCVYPFEQITEEAKLAEVALTV